MSNNGRKVPVDATNPIDNFCLSLSTDVFPYLRKWKLTPNHITSISFAFGLLAIFLFIKKNYISSVIAYLISYMFDCWDGNYARKYDMVTKFGDYYDHITDWIISGVMLLLLFRHYYINGKMLIFLPLTALFMIYIGLRHYGCSEVYYEDKNKAGDSAKFTKNSCPYRGKDKNFLHSILKNFRYMGFGTVILYMCILILLSYVVDKQK